MEANGMLFVHFAEVLTIGSLKKKFLCASARGDLNSGSSE